MSFKPFDKPKAVHIKSISAHRNVYLNNDNRNLSSVSFPAAIFNSVAAPFVSLTSDLVTGKLNDLNPNAEKFTIEAPRYKYGFDADGFALAYQGPLSPLAYRFGNDLHRGVGRGVSYKSKNYFGGLSNPILDAVVIDGMMIVVDRAHLGGTTFCSYQDISDPDSVPQVLFTALVDGAYPFNVKVIDGHNSSEVISQAMVVDNAAAQQELRTNPYSGHTAHARIDPNDLTISVMNNATIWHGVDPIFETFYGVMDASIAIGIYNKKVGEKVERHAAILTTLSEGVISDNDSLSFRNSIADQTYTADLDYPARITALKAVNEGVAFNWFDSETVAMKSSINSNIPCSGRVWSMLKKRINVYDMSDPPAIIGDEWVAASGTPPVNGDTMDADTLEILAGSEALFNGTVSMTYEITGSRKFAYAFIDGQRQFVTLKASTGKSSVTFNATVNLVRPRIHKNVSSTVSWLSPDISDAANTYRSDPDHIERKSVFDAFLLPKGDDLWDVTSTNTKMVMAMVYDDGAFLDSVDGINQAVGGYTFNYKASGWSFADSFSGGSYRTKLAVSTYHSKLTNADKRQPVRPLDMLPNVGFLNIDEKISAASARRPGNLYDVTIQTPTDEVDFWENFNNEGETALFIHASDGVTTLTVSQLLDNAGLGNYSSLSFVKYNDSTMVDDYSAPILLSQSPVVSKSKGQPLVIQQDSAAQVGGLVSPVHQFNNTWLTLQEAYDKHDDVLFDGDFPTAFVLNAVPTPAVYVIAGQGIHGDEAGAAVGWRQWNSVTSEWDIVWLDVGTAPEPIIVPTNGERAYIQPGDMGGIYANSTFIYQSAGTNWEATVKSEYATPSYSEAQMLIAEESGGLIEISQYSDSENAFINVAAQNSIAYRVPINGTNKYLYTVSLFRFNDLPAGDNLTRTYVGDDAGNVLEDITIMPADGGDIDVTTLATGTDNDELVIGLVE